ncbi:16S ribosomal RNA methyltransferase RsmE [Acetobacter estunensis NRIC 0472]|uniref:Ribosomal RNA small subunit methyltransferase E n=1 Tax=Acetobacter estunensis TaxID=104097 RepID=A0A967BA15_9PROT|nr:16S rRNA (uracil(1498)-N(3))-methyltransferase [Acetobacter estunensis]NHO54721.1 16S rRNA (uracil(1498)-N(3))-methyltransferase [Acetobacter estunensis]GBQ21290.1 16S ribosomal RNA methyltransferase RsmE [Acetobacter estunensis NRIC 0472]
MSALHTLPRLHVSVGETLVAHADLPMTPEQARYLGTVLRRAEGDEVRLFNERDGEWLARIAGVRKDKGCFTVVEQLRAPAPEPGCVLVFALLKRDSTDLVIRMGTELGVSRFVPVITERTVSGRVKSERLESIATEAAEQCERLSVPVVEAPVRLTDFLGAWPADFRLFVAVERQIAQGEGPVAFAGARVGDGVLIGPEGGFSAGELDVLRARPFVTPVTLGNRVLRAETAVTAALALFDSQLRNA